MILSKNEWQQLAQKIVIEGRAFINGQYQNAIAGETFDCVSPIDGRILGQIARCKAKDVDLAVTVARQAFQSGIWSQRAPADRKQVLQQLAQLMLKHGKELALLESLDMGKPVEQAYQVDVLGAINAIEWHAEAIDKVYDEIAPTPKDQLGLVTKEPVGVVGAIVPWNFPLMMACWKLGPALATGNSVILKPSERSPLSVIRLAQLAIEAGLPQGILNVLPGFGYEAGEAIGLHQDIDTVVFTGSTQVAKQLMVYAGQSNMKRIWLEAGGKSPHIIFADANLDEATKAAAAGIAFNQGEVCTAGSRLLVERSVKDQVIEKLLKAIKEWQPGHPLDPATSVGALVDEKHLGNVLKYIQAGIDEGGKLLIGGKRTLLETGGCYVEPTIFDEVTNDMKIAREEIFGPVLSIITFDTVEEAITIANDTQYGLGAGIWTSDLTKAHQTARAIRSGSVWVNQYDAGDMTAPFGGFKQSGNGRDKSLHAFDKYTEIKATWIKLI